jgi:hypothetical protein
MTRGTALAGSVLLALGATFACSSSSGDDGNGELGQSPDEVRETIPGPVAKDTDAEAWHVENAWADTNTANAKKAGIAWGQNSGLSWEEKFRKWTASFGKIDSVSYGKGKTIQIQTPQGKTAAGPVLQCKDVALWLRISFSAFYKLPFYMTGARSNGQVMYMGHFGVVDRNGDPVPGFPLFRQKYRDYEKTWQPGQPWPHDVGLRAMHDGDDDGETGVKVGDVTLGDGDGAGAYDDEVFLNKRAGWLRHWVSQYFGSINLADGANMFHIKPEATSTGDALIERWQKEGIGHTLPVVSSVTLPNGKMQLEVASGSMPRREPLWEDQDSSAGYFKSDNCGGVGNTSDDPPVPLAKLGGGIRRWRTPILVGGRWENDVPVVDHPVYIEDTNLDAISARPARFADLLAPATPEGARDAAIAIIQSARNALEQHPASCSQRTRREDAFKDLYKVMKDSFMTDATAVDQQYRQLEDYVFAELDYTTSKTCCWNSTTPDMNQIIQDFAQKELDANTKANICKQPTPFMSSGGGKYDTWKNFAAQTMRADKWKEWSEDEPCNQRGVAQDTLGARGKADYCAANPVSPPPPPPPPPDADAGADGGP